jgi:hypothetical protein
MTEDEYYAEVQALGLLRTQFKETFVTLHNVPISVPLARDLSPEARRETTERIKRALADTA